MLNWRRDPGYEQRMKQLGSEILRVRSDREQIERDILRVWSAGERSKERTKLIEKEIEQLRQENARLKTLNASVKQLCFPPESSSIPQTSTAPDCKLS
jgi:chromosome segregation ATPase